MFSNFQPLNNLLMKIAARAGVRRLRNMYNQLNNPAQLRPLPRGASPAQQAAHQTQHNVQSTAQHQNLLKQIPQMEQQSGNILANRNTPRGSQIKVLGGGAEGVAQHVLMPGQHQVFSPNDPLASRRPGQFSRETFQQRNPQQPQLPQQTSVPGGSQVVKTYDPTGPLYSEQIMNKRRELAGQQLPGIATTHQMGNAPRNVMGHQTPYAINEFVHGKAPSNPDEIAALKNQTAGLVPGHELLDVRRANMIKDSRTGQTKVVDYMPVPNADVVPQFRRNPESMMSMDETRAQRPGQKPRSSPIEFTPQEVPEGYVPINRDSPTGQSLGQLGTQSSLASTITPQDIEKRQQVRPPPPPPKPQNPMTPQQQNYLGEANTRLAPTQLSPQQAHLNAQEAQIREDYAREKTRNQIYNERLLQQAYGRGPQLQAKRPIRPPPFREIQD